MFGIENWLSVSWGTRMARHALMSAAVLFLICGTLLFHKAAQAQALQPAVSAEEQTRPDISSELIPDPAVVYNRLPNGIRYVMMRNGEPKDRVSMHLVIQAGSYHESENQLGVAHFLEHMMFNGSTHFPPGELVKYFQLIGMQFGPDANAHTGFMETVYDVLLPEGDADSLGKGLLVLKDYAQGALLLEEEINRERGIILAEKRARDSAEYRTFVAALQFGYPDARFSHRLPIGDEAVIRSVDRELMKRFYDTWYRPEKMAVVLVGEFNVSSAEGLLKKTFGDISARAPEKVEPDFGGISHKGNKVFYHHEPEIGSTTVSIETVRKVEKRKDSRQLRKEDLILNMAGSMVQNRLEEMVSRPDAPFTSASISMGRFLQEVEYGELSAECSPDDWEAALERIEQTLRKALLYGFTEGELLRVKKEYLSSLDTAVAQASTRESSRLAREIIRHINNDRVFLSPEQEKTLYAPVVKELTLDQAHAALKRAWAPEHRLIILAGNASVTGKDNQPAENRILSVFESSAMREVEKPEEVETSVFPYLPKPAPEGKIIRRAKIEDLGIVQVDFENGVRLNLKKTDFEAGKVRVAIAFGSGRSSDPSDMPGLSVLGGEVVNESGLGRMDNNELAYALAGTQVSAYLEVEDDRFVYRGSCTTPEIELLVQTLYAHIVDPGFREDAFNLSMSRFEQQYQSLSRDIDGGMTLQGRKFLAGGDNRFGMPTLEELKKIKLSHIREWILAALDRTALEVNIVGDVEMGAAVDTVAAYFGAMSKIESAVDKRSKASPPFPAGKSLDIRVDTQIPKGLVVIAYPTDDFWVISRTRRLSVLANIFSERLRETIREQLGASYSPFAFNQSSRAYSGYGALQAYVYVSPDAATLVSGAVMEISENMVRNGISDEDLERSLKPILTGIKDFRRTNDYWLDSVLIGSSRYPQQLDWSRTFESDYAAITTKELRRFAERYLVNSKAACITILPMGEEPEGGGE